MGRADQECHLSRDKRRPWGRWQGQMMLRYGAPRHGSRCLTVDPIAPDDQGIQEAARVLRGGGLVALPTETVYGLGARALDERALARVFAAKGRPVHHPFDRARPRRGTGPGAGGGVARKCIASGARVLAGAAHTHRRTAVGRSGGDRGRWGFHRRESTVPPRRPRRSCRVG